MRPAANAAVFFRPYRGLKATAKGVRPLRGGFLPFHTVASVPRLCGVGWLTRRSFTVARRPRLDAGGGYAAGTAWNCYATILVSYRQVVFNFS